MDYAQVKRDLKIESNKLFKPLGFKSMTDPQGCRFAMTKGDLQIRFGYGVSNYGNEFYVGLFGSLSLNPIQRIENLVLGKDDSDTLLMNTSEYFKDLNYRFLISNESDLAAWIKIIERFYYDYILPFSEKYGSVPAIDKLINDNPTEKVKYLNDVGARIIVGLIAAKLNHNPRYSELISVYRKEADDKLRNYFMYPECIKVIDYLDKITSFDLKKM